MQQARHQDAHAEGSRGDPDATGGEYGDERPLDGQARGVARYRLPLGRGDVGPPRVAGGGMDALPLMVFGVRRLDRPERSIIRFSAAPHHTCAVLHAAWYGRSRGTTTR